MLIIEGEDKKDEDSKEEQSAHPHTPEADMSLPSHTSKQI